MQNFLTEKNILKAVVGRGYISLYELMHLKPGDVVRTSDKAGEPAVITVNGQPLFQGEFVIINNVYGIRICKNSPVYPEEFIGRKSEVNEVLLTEIVLGEIELSFEELRGASKYSVISLDKNFEEIDGTKGNVFFYVQGKKYAEGLLSVAGEFFAVKITKIYAECRPEMNIEARSTGYLLDKDDKSIKIYDMRKPDKFTFSQILKIKEIHETALKNMKFLMPEIKDHRIKLVDQLAFYEIFDSMKTGYNFSIINTGYEKRGAGLKTDQKFLIEKENPVNKLSEENRKYFENFFKEIMKVSSKEFLICRKKGSQLDKISDQASIEELIINPLRNAWKDYTDINVSSIRLTDDFNEAKIIPDKDMLVLVNISSDKGGGEMSVIYPFIFLESILETLN